ncbi:hypothetical protein BE04_13155 [Sorangium cellulosum]|uniref:Uncharacterized protein n=2 Tax=Sorangium cellulosum TaxID=56 RepID=A0A150PGE9_SORCE|nr:hypothetical protein SCE1572_07315 [Sorangium cellulosum So0157-2]KYF54763.1 hypothetical protein BE04_13155 [Sorangium cellulosum]
MAHLGVLDRDTAVGRNALPDANGPVLGGFQVLVSHLCERIQIHAQRLLDDVVQMAVDPLLQ